ncbi:MAG TPA: DUF2892 domain-containing protein [Gemmatimonadales bacterium]|nr:DUF2892 domain-containing protein [Gemmatimonadales bacterium]
MRTNITLPDRFARFIAGVLLLGLFGALPSPWRYVTLIGLFPLGTALIGSCPLYTFAGWNRRQETMREVQHGRQS